MHAEGPYECPPRRPCADRKTPSLAIGGSAHSQPSTSRTGERLFSCEGHSLAPRRPMLRATMFDYRKHGAVVCRLRAPSPASRLSRVIQAHYGTCGRARRVRSAWRHRGGTKHGGCFPTARALTLGISACRLCPRKPLPHPLSRGCVRQRWPRVRGMKVPGPPMWRAGLQFWVSLSRLVALPPAVRGARRRADRRAAPRRNDRPTSARAAPRAAAGPRASTPRAP